MDYKILFCTIDYTVYEVKFKIVSKIKSGILKIVLYDYITTP
jgi:hypothetical protein